ncbi:hypothetical protein RJ639_033092 [Escallonia herrerae]|uniref:Transmembrane protein 135 N-terminal domain-containing protein n=1 Tax=Escallonia herrerae TaxID=1293975 RepID=A0AA89BDX0_9ASTE|nr:hypothetical protein RJ639_033092 [Escallonia herrerae]
MASVSPASSPPQPADSSDGAAAERRLREAEDRLREAMEELQRRQRRESMVHPPCDHADESCVANAIGNLCQSFLLSYGVRVGIGILLRAFKLARRQSYSSLIDLKKSHWHVHDFVEMSREKEVVVGRWSGKGVALVMYAFVMRPESLPQSYQDFIQKTGPVAQPVYKAVRECCRGSPVDVASLSAYLANKGDFSSVKLEEFPSIIPCSVIHPETHSCLAHTGYATSATFKKTYPLYFSLTFVPFVVLRLQKFMDAPARTCWHAVTGAVRSTTFLSSFVGIFQAVICLHRKVASKDHKLVYWFSGGIAALSVLLEKKARRKELALYVLPRAGESLWYILVNRHLLPDIRNAEVALFCACMGGLMYYLEHEPDTMAPFLRGLIRRFLASKISNPGPSSNRSASYTYLQTLDAMKPPKLQEDRDTEASASQKYNLESIPGL